MFTLDKWRPFLITPRTVSFPRLSLIGHDREQPIVEGVGELRMPTPSRFEYTLTGLPQDVPFALRWIERFLKDPYDGLSRFRLIGTDEAAVEWSLGWTVPRIEFGREAWKFIGHIDGAWPDDHGDVAEESCTELIFLVPTGHPIAVALDRFVRAEQSDGDTIREYVLHTLQSTIRFAYDPTEGTFAIAAAHSPQLPATYAENWLAEPLRILFGQLIFPRLVARNLGGGRTHVSVRRSLEPVRGVGWAALWSGDDGTLDRDAFWARYAELLGLIAGAVGPGGHPNFEAHEVTKLYEEIVQAASGTRWVWALTFASCIEGLANMIDPPGRKRPDVNDSAVDALVMHIKTWSGDGRLKQNAVNAVHRAARTTTILSLRTLVAAGAIAQEQLDAWEDIRHAVMHGRLVSPYSSAEEDRKLHALSAMMHALTLEILRRSAASPTPNDQDDVATGAT